MSGSVVTFYSFKGGVGRTMALASSAAVLSKWGYRVLCIDWDLEAPGLGLYFAPWLKRPPDSGLVDLLTRYLEEGSVNWREYVVRVEAPHHTIDFLPAGVQAEPAELNPSLSVGIDGGYSRQVQDLDWKKLFQSRFVGEFLETTRQEWRDVYDFVLVDSRTGYTDNGGICTIHLPDLLVLLTTANKQSIDGIVEVARRARARRNDLPVDRARLLVLPVVTRFESRVEFEVSQRWLTILGERFEEFYQDWRHRNVDPTALLRWTRIPYVPFWSFGERIPTLEEGTADPDSVGFAMETLAALIAHNLAETALLSQSRDSYVAQARRGGVRMQTGAEEFAYDIFLSYTSRDADLANVLHEALKDRGLRVTEPSAVPLGEEWSKAIERALAQSQHLVTILGTEPSRAQELESKLFLESTFDPSTSSRAGGSATHQRRIVPVLRSESHPGQIAGFFSNLQWLEEGTDTNALADAIVTSLAVPHGNA